jgi:guanylate cyclase soluble subunit beta
LIHRYLKDHIIDSAGEEVWQSIATELRISPADLISQEVYDDALTFELVEVASRRLGRSVGDCLTAFGRFWVMRVSRDTYRAVMDFTGRDLATFLKNLDRMHHSVAAVMPRSRLPSFTLIEQDEEHFLVQYRSERSGLEPFVEGLLEGLLEWFKLTGDVLQVKSDNIAAEFLITLA